MTAATQGSMDKIKNAFSILTNCESTPINNGDIADIPIIGLTALAMSSDRERCLAAGMNDYMSKPIMLNELVAVIQSHLPPSEENQPQ